MEKSKDYKKVIPDPGRCPACAGRFAVTENGYYCTSCGYMGWFTHDQYFEG